MRRLICAFGFLIAARVRGAREKRLPGGDGGPPILRTADAVKGVESISGVARERVRSKLFCLGSNRNELSKKTICS